MEKLKKRLLGLLVILILVISVLSTVYNVYAVGKEYQLNTQLNNNNLKIYKKRINFNEGSCRIKVKMRQTTLDKERQ